MTNHEAHSNTSAWLLFIPHLPPKPDYLRVKLRRRLERLGALPLKNSVYVLPDREETRESFQWLAREIEGDGGEATLCTAEFVSGTTDEDVVTSFRDARTADYRDIAVDAGALDADSRDAELSQLMRRFTAVTSVDFFGTTARSDAEAALKRAETRMHRRSETAARQREADAEIPVGRTWVTRAGVFVDRIASAWLIRRFIDANAHFKFVGDSRYTPSADELRFDMFDGEYTHEGDRCTFEVLIARFGLEDRALEVLAEVVHDLDLNDEKYRRPEASGVLAVLRGIVATTTDDDERIARGGALFDGLYATFSGARP